jgi:hypothetical protein
MHDNHLSKKLIHEQFIKREVENEPLIELQGVLWEIKTIRQGPLSAKRELKLTIQACCGCEDEALVHADFSKRI